MIIEASTKTTYFIHNLHNLQSVCKFSVQQYIALVIYFSLTEKVTFESIVSFKVRNLSICLVNIIISVDL